MKQRYGRCIRRDRRHVRRAAARRLVAGARRAQVNPKSGNDTLADGTLFLKIGSNIRPTVTLEYFVYDNLGIEVLAALSFKHDIDIDGLGRVGSTQHLPPTLSLQYHFNGGGRISPFIGTGLNYIVFFDEETTGALDGSDLSLKDPWGLISR